MTPAILLVPDKFKGTLTAAEAAQALSLGLRDVWPKARVFSLPLSDGGEGFVETLAHARQGKLYPVATIDPLGRRCKAPYALLPDGTAVVGLTEASGLWRVPLSRRDPGVTTTTGTGRILAKVLRQGARKIVVGIGGRSTNDGGIGLVAALGFRFLDAGGHDIPLHGEGLARLVEIVPPRRLPKLEITVASDVTHRLYGPQGAAFQFGAQKGATPEQVKRLDENLRRLARVAEESLGVSAHRKAGAGAAGGCGYGLMTFLGAKRVSGFDLFAEASDLRALIRRHDLVVTGEGCFDRTSFGGKGPSAVGTLAKRSGKEAWLVCGKCLLTPKERKASPFAKIGEVSAVAPSPEASFKEAGRYLREAVRRLAVG